MATRRNSKGDVSWHIPGKKRPIAYSTVAVSNAIKLYSEMVSSPTPRNILEYIESNRLIGMYEEKEILSKYIELGRGDIPMNLA